MIESRANTVPRKIVRTIVTLGLAILCALPLYYVIVSSFKTSVDMTKHPFALPTEWTFANYAQAVADGSIWTAFLNTLIVTVFGVILQVAVGSLAAYAMVLKKNWLTVGMGAVLTLAFCIPVQSTLLPLYKMEGTLGIVDSLPGLIVLYLADSAFCYYLIVGYMRKLPTELFEAARVDGASPFRIYWQIVLPLIRPILATVIVFQTLAVWNDFLRPSVFVSSAEKRTVVLQVYNAVNAFSTNWPLFMAITCIALAPVVVFFMFCQRWIVSGLVAGAVKG
ncbi:carbohydrate ABC transporter permease [Bifidobacterium olomucense]|uniref:Binding-protein-dependent transport system inner membrane component n=1 Tax=Bifidobacterium olomucense TaxID=2675324 RepID=A0A7Y0EYZ9_9BIFI|nr:carbohydrate ABC transporter permease [Bifidobacterium sp. DSM 109959]NMM98980.1 binding-protein-dependent transport system inner membrane component [Bifidobacterium sp. DSM 109959]